MKKDHRSKFSNLSNWKIYCDDHSSLWSTTAVQIYELFHVYFTSFHSSREIWTQQIGFAPNVWLHSSVGRASHRYRGGHRFESRWSLDFFRLLLSNCLNWKIYCDDHSSLWSTTAVQIHELFHIYFISKFTWLMFYLNFILKSSPFLFLILQTGWYNQE